jgi:uncharacterized protein (UPF0276 family)
MPHSNIPARAGLGLKPQHYRVIVETRPDIGFFEVHAENYMGAGGPPHRWLEAICRDYPLSLHGVGLSIGAPGRLDRAHLDRLAALERRYRPGLVSEHLAWSTHAGAFLDDLLPLPYTRETLALARDHVDEAQQVLGRRILIENPATYVRFAASEMAETEFLAELAARTGCGLLLDVANVRVCAVNHGFDPYDYLDAFPLDRVAEIHLAGAAPTRDARGAPLLIDAHDRAVADEVWALHAVVVARIGPRPSLIEWDNDIPEWAELAAQARRADAALALQPAEARHVLA